MNGYAPCEELTRPPESLSHNAIHRRRVTAADVGGDGLVGGGTVLDWMHRAAFVTAARWSGRYCLVASVGDVHLNRPIGVGEFVDVHAGLVYTGKTSMHILVTVRSGGHARADGDHTAQCLIVFVAVADDGERCAVAPWTPTTMLELQRHRQARIRMLTRRRIESAMAAADYTADNHGSRHNPAHADANGSWRIHGGRVLQWVADAADACGSDWIGAPVITSYLAGVRFCRPIAATDVVDVAARVIHTGPRTVHVGVEVFTDDGHVRHRVAQALVVAISLDGSGDARAVPRWLPGTDEDRRLDAHARHLIELRQFLEPFTAAAIFETATAAMAS